MPTERLYYHDPYATDFDATVTSVAARDNCLLVRLDRTAFYPTSGGQPFNTGRLGMARVVDVFEAEDTDVVHVVKAVDPIEAGDHPHGAVDWQRRFDHMRQHSGQHVLSAACDRLFGVSTVSFHLGAETSTIDIARELTASEIAAVEDEANRIVGENRPVTIRFASAEEASRLPLRKEPARQGTIRLIEVESFDLSACGGTHVSATGAIGLIGVISCERFKGGQRLEFVCGGRVLKRLRTLRDAVAGSIRLLSVLPDELPSAIDRLQADAKDRGRAIVALQNELARYRAEEMAEAAETTARLRLVCRAIDADAKELKTLASAITTRPGLVAVLTSTSPPVLVVIARSPDVEIRSNDVLSALTALFGGRGGGKPDLAQGGGLSGPVAEILAEARRLIGLGQSL